MPYCDQYQPMVLNPSLTNRIHSVSQPTIPVVLLALQSPELLWARIGSALRPSYHPRPHPQVLFFPLVAYLFADDSLGSLLNSKPALDSHSPTKSIHRYDLVRWNVLQMYTNSLLPTSTHYRVNMCWTWNRCVSVISINQNPSREMFQFNRIDRCHVICPKFLRQCMIATKPIRFDELECCVVSAGSQNSIRA